MSTTKYVHTILKFNDLDGNLITEKIAVISDGYILYFNCQHLMLQLGTEARCFFDYLCESMRSDNNEVKIDTPLKKAFIEQITRITSKKVSPAINSLNKYVSNFKKLGLIISTVNTKKEQYSVNPRYAFKGRKKDRLTLIANMIKERIRNRESVRGLIDTPGQTFGINYSVKV